MEMEDVDVGMDDPMDVVGDEAASDEGQDEAEDWEAAFERHSPCSRR